MKLEGERIFVTEASKGIGAAIARDAAEEGARVSFVDIDVAGGEDIPIGTQECRASRLFSPR